MPSKITSWFTHHDDVSLLHVTSNDPRRNGQQELALFDNDVYAALIGHEWTIRHGKIENTLGKSFHGIISDLYKLGTLQIEPGIDFRRCNFRKREVHNQSNALMEWLANPDNVAAKKARLEAKYQVTYYPRMKYRNRDEFVTIDVPTDNKMVTVPITINKCMVHHLPTKLIYRPYSRYVLYLIPNRQQAKRRRGDHDNRHGRALHLHLIDKQDNPSNESYLRLNYTDCRFDWTTNKYMNGITTHNIYHKVADGVVLDVFIPRGLSRFIWTTHGQNVYPQLGAIEPTEDKHCYYLLDADIIDDVKEHNWVDYDCGQQPLCKHMIDNEGTPIGYMLMKKFICNLNGIDTGEQTEHGRISKFYERALNKSEAGDHKARAKFENTIMSDVNTSNRMYIKKKHYKYKQIHCDKYLAIPELGVTALDMRFQSIRIKGKNEDSNS